MKHKLLSKNEQLSNELHEAEIFVKKVNEWLEREPHLTSDEYDAWQEEIGMEEVPTSADGYEIKTLVVE